MSRYDININDREKRDQTVWKRTVEPISHASDMGRIGAREAQLNSYHLETRSTMRNQNCVNVESEAELMESNFLG